MSRIVMIRFVIKTDDDKEAAAIGRDIAEQVTQEIPHWVTEATVIAEITDIKSSYPQRQDNK